MQLRTLFKCFLIITIITGFISPYVYSITFSSKTMVTIVRGDVKVQKGGSGPWVDAYRKQPLAVGDVVKTLDNGKAEVSLANSSVIRMGNNTQIEIPGSKLNTGKKTSKMKVAFGMVWAKAKHQDKSLQIETPMGVAGVRGTELTVEVNNVTEDEEVGCYQGRVWGTYGGKTYEFDAGNALKAGKNGIQTIKIPKSKIDQINNTMGNDGNYASNDNNPPQLNFKIPKIKIRTGRLTINGKASDNVMVEKVIAFVNGKRRVLPIAPGKNVSFRFDVELKVGEKNEIAVIAFDSSKNAKRIKKSVNLSVKTKIKKLEVTPTGTLKSGTLKIDGEVSDDSGNIVKITVGGKSVELNVTGTKFSHTVNVSDLEDGKQEVKAELLFQGKVYDTKIIEIEVKKEESSENEVGINIEAPENSIEDFEAKASLSNYSENSKATVYLNGTKKETVDLSGTSQDISIQISKNDMNEKDISIKVEIEDSTGTVVLSKEVTVKYGESSEISATLSVSAPKKADKDFSITGSVTGVLENDSIIVSYNGKDITINIQADETGNASFESKIAIDDLKDGDNSIIVKLVDPAGAERVSQTVSVSKEPVSSGLDPEINFVPSTNVEPDGSYIIEGSITNWPENSSVKVKFAETEFSQDKDGDNFKVVVSADKLKFDQDLPIIIELYDDNGVIISKEFKVNLSSDNGVGESGTPEINAILPPNVDQEGNYIISGSIINMPVEGGVLVSFNGGDVPTDVEGDTFRAVVLNNVIKFDVDIPVVIEVVGKEGNTIVKKSLTVKIGTEPAAAGLEPMLTIDAPPEMIMVDRDMYPVKIGLINSPPEGTFRVKATINGNPISLSQGEGSIQGDQILKDKDNIMKVWLVIDGTPQPAIQKVIKFMKTDGTAPILNIVSPPVLITEKRDVYPLNIEIINPPPSEVSKLEVYLNGELIATDINSEIPAEKLLKDKDNIFRAKLFVKGIEVARAPEKRVKFLNAAGNVLIMLDKPDIGIPISRGLELDVNGNIDGKITRLVVSFAGNEQSIDIESGQFSFIFPTENLSEGDQRITVKAYDGDNLVSTIDRDITIVKPAAGQVEVVVGNNSPILVDVLNGAFHIEVPINEGDKTIKVRPPQGEAGNITLTSPLDGAFGDPTIIDGMLIDAGDSATEAEKNDNTPPDLIVQEPNVGFGDPLVISGIVIDQAPNPLNKVFVVVSGTPYEAEVDNGNFRIEIPMDGRSNLITLQASDAAGNLNNPVVLQDNDPPIVVISAPQNGTYGVDSLNTLIMDNDDGTFSMQASGIVQDLVDINPITQITYYTERNGSPTDFDIDSGNFSFNINVKKGYNYFKVEARDAAGNLTIEEINYNFIPDDQPPAITLSSPTPGTKYITPAEILISGSITEKFLNSMRVTLTHVASSNSTSQELELNKDLEVKPFTVTFPAIQVGEYRLLIEAADVDGRTAERAFLLTVEAPENPPGLPNVELRNNASNAGSNEYDF